MSDRTRIEWTDATWTPIRARWFEPQDDGSGKERVGWHCEKVDGACNNCYAEGINLRLGTRLEFKPGHLKHIRSNGDPRGEVTVFLDEKMLLAPLRWKKPRMIFVNSMTDTFGRFVTDEMLDRMFAVMALCPQHKLQVLTKRPERMQDYLTANPGIRIRNAMQAIAAQPIIEMDWPLPNVWLGTSISDQASADDRIPHLLATPAAVRFLSAEPLLGPVDLESAWHGESALNGECWGDCAWCHNGHPPMHNCQRGRQSSVAFEKGRDGLDWVIVGGESGLKARPLQPDWARSLRDQCKAAGVSFFFKQWGEWAPALHDPEHDGQVLRQTETVGKFDSWKTPVFDPDRTEGVNWRRVGKARAGRMLDGQEWSQMPGGAK